jgi:hypothetical protein
LRAVTSCRSMVSGSISLPLPGFFSPFPHGTCALSVAVQYLALDRGRPGFRQGFSCPAVLRYCIKETETFRVRGFHTVSLTFPESFRYISVFSNSSGHPHAALQPRFMRFRLLRVRSPLLAESLLISVPGLLRWFTSPSLALLPYFIQQCSVRITPYGLPHSAICGLTDMCSFPQLIAAYHGLLRLTAPTGIHHRPIVRLTILLFLLLLKPFRSSAAFLSSAPLSHSDSSSFSSFPVPVLSKNLPFRFSSRL